MLTARRAFLGAMVGANGAGAVTASDDASLPAPSELFTLLSRTSFGIRDGELEAAQAMGYDAWLEYQLAPEAIGDGGLEATLAANLVTLGMTNGAIIALAESSGRQFQAVEELRAATFLRQIYSPRQLYEVMVEFWTNHFNVQHVDGPVQYFKTVEDRTVIRANALGNFGTMLRADARSPAMLYYLDNYSNVVSGPNENYARELLELHTLGADGGYDENDVAEVARAFTGWTITPYRTTGDVQFAFTPGRHDYGAKRILGVDFPAGRGVEEGDQVLDMLIAHPSTARFLARKLVERFVADTRVDALIEAVAQTYLATGGDIKSMLRTLFRSTEFRTSGDRKFKRPAEFVVSALRTLAPQFSGNYLRSVNDQLVTFGQVPYLWPTPDGYPDTREYWINTSAMVNRWSFGFALAENTLSNGIRVDVNALVGSARTPTALVDRLAQRILRRPLADEDRFMLIQFASDGTSAYQRLSGATLTSRARELIGLMLGSAYFQYR